MYELLAIGRFVKAQSRRCRPEKVRKVARLIYESGRAALNAVRNRQKAENAASKLLYNPAMIEPRRWRTEAPAMLSAEIFKTRRQTARLRSMISDGVIESPGIRSKLRAMAINHKRHTNNLIEAKDAGHADAKAAYDESWALLMDVKKLIDNYDLSIGRSPDPNLLR